MAFVDVVSLQRKNRWTLDRFCFVEQERGQRPEVVVTQRKVSNALQGVAAQPDRPLMQLHGVQAEVVQRKLMEAGAVALGEAIAAQVQVPELRHLGQLAQVIGGECDVLVDEPQRSQPRQVLGDRRDAENERGRCSGGVVGPADLQRFKLRHLPEQALKQTLVLRPTGEGA
ncbi:hypothetical protein D3C81_1407690 [compost metagenome]